MAGRDGACGPGERGARAPAPFSRPRALRRPRRAGPRPPRAHCEVRRRRVPPGRVPGAAAAASSCRRLRRPLHRLPGSDLAGKGEGGCRWGPRSGAAPGEGPISHLAAPRGSQDRRHPDLSGSSAARAGLGPSLGLSSVAYPPEVSCLTETRERAKCSKRTYGEASDRAHRSRQVFAAGI